MRRIFTFNPLAPDDVHIRRTAQLTSRCYILNIYSTNILTEYFKHPAHSPFFFLSSKCRLFHNATFFGSCNIHILNTGCAKIWKKKIRRQKVKIHFNATVLPMSGSSPGEFSEWESVYLLLPFYTWNTPLPKIIPLLSIILLASSCLSHISALFSHPYFSIITKDAIQVRCM